MSEKHRNGRENKKKAASTPKEKKAAKRARKESGDMMDQEVK